MRTSLAVLVMLLNMQASFAGVAVTDPPSGQIRETKVLILGAGIAGITAADTLTQENITDFIMLEGSDRIGGRMRSIPFGGIIIETSGWVIKKDVSNPLWRAIQSYNISGVKFDEDSVVVKEADGNDVTDTAAAEGWVRLEAAGKKMKELYSKRMKQGSDMSVRACLNIGGWQADTPVDEVLEIFDYDFEFGNRPGVDSCSSNGFRQKYTSDYYYVTDERGLESVVHDMANTFFKTDDNRLVKNEFVRTVNYSSSGVTVETDNGNIYHAEYAVLTFSVAVLKSGFVTFNPPLPHWKTDNLFKVRSEDYAQIYLKFPNQFWDDHNYILHAHPTRGYFPIFINHNAPSLPVKGTNILELIVMAEEASRVQSMSTPAIVAEIMTMLRKIYSPSIPEPIDTYVTRWKNDRLYQCSFSNVEPSITPEAMLAIRAPVERLYFAGEAYSVFDGYSSGAAISGEENAKKISACIKGETCYAYNPNPNPDTSQQPTTCRSSKLKIELAMLSLMLVIVQRRM